jgi:hypothetical protein
MSSMRRVSAASTLPRVPRSMNHPRNIGDANRLCHVPVGDDVFFREFDFRRRVV